MIDLLGSTLMYGGIKFDTAFTCIKDASSYLPQGETVLLEELQNFESKSE